MKLHLQCRTQDEIAKAVGVSQVRVNEVLSEIADLQKAIKPSELDPKLGAYCRSYALEAERKMGQMLIEGKAAGEVAKQGRPKNLTAGKVIPTKCDDVGISWRESAERKMGQMLKETERADGGDAQRTRLRHVTESLLMLMRLSHRLLRWAAVRVDEIEGRLS